MRFLYKENSKFTRASTGPYLVIFCVHSREGSVRLHPSHRYIFAAEGLLSSTGVYISTVGRSPSVLWEYIAVSLYPGDSQLAVHLRVVQRCSGFLVSRYLQPLASGRIGHLRNSWSGDLSRQGFIFCQGAILMCHSGSPMGGAYAVLHAPPLARE
jgi:hypothetical protein